MSKIRKTKSSGTKYCGQCMYWTGARSVNGSYLIYDTNTKGKCAGKSFPCSNKEVKAEHTCSKFSLWDVL